MQSGKKRKALRPQMEGALLYEGGHLLTRKRSTPSLRKATT